MASKEKFDIMISYNHKSGADYMKKLHRELEDRGFKVWVDVEQMYGSLYDGMAKGVARAYILIALISKGYKESKSCMEELKQANKLQKVIIPVKVEKYTPPDDSSLSFILNDRIYYKVYEGCDETGKLMDAINKQLEKCKTGLEPPEGAPTQESVASGNQRLGNEDGTSGSSQPDGKEKGSENEDVTSDSSQPDGEEKGSENEDAATGSYQPEGEEKAASLEPLRITENYGEPTIKVILDRRPLLLEIASKLERNANDWETLALKFDFKYDDVSQIKRSTHPSRRFFQNLGATNGHITLEELKKVIECDLKQKNKSIFLEIEKDIESGRAPVTLKSTLSSVIDGEKRAYFQKNIADKLYENDSLLPSWKDVAGHYRYTFEQIKDFEKLIDNKERPTVVVLEKLLQREHVPTISLLKSKLKEMGRHDIIEEINDSFKDQNS